MRVVVALCVAVWCVPWCVSKLQKRDLWIAEVPTAPRAPKPSLVRSRLALRGSVALFGGITGANAMFSKSPDLRANMP